MTVSAYTTLADLKSAAASDAGYLFAPPSGSDGATRSGVFLFVSEDFTGNDDDMNIVELDNVPLTTGALVRQSSDDVSFRSSGTGAQRRGTQTKVQEVVSTMDFGAIGDGTLHTVEEWIIPNTLGRYASFAELKEDYPHVVAVTDSIDWAAIQAGVDHVQSTVDYAAFGSNSPAAGPQELFFPAGLYMLNRAVRITRSISLRGDGHSEFLVARASSRCERYR